MYRKHSHSIFNIQTPKKILTFDYFLSMTAKHDNNNNNKKQTPNKILTFD